MTSPDFHLTFTVDLPAREVFDAIVDPRRWWSGEIRGEADRPGATFTYRYRDAHRSRQEVTELEPGRRVVWRVLDSHLSFLAEPDAWSGTEIVFELAERGGRTEVRFAHRGLTPDCECYGACSSGWSALVLGNLRRLIASGMPQPDAFAAG
ncbi:MAG: SRPBCC domain-containing protein [Anaeromyxobacter sp.]